MIRYLGNYWEKPGAQWFIFALAGQAVFCFVYAGALVTFDPVLREQLEIIAVIALHWLGVPFLGFVLAYTGRRDLLRSWAFRGLFVFPVTATLLLPFNDRHGLYWTGFEIDSVYGTATAAYTFEPLFFITVLGGITAAGIGGLLLFDTVLSYGPLYRGEAIAVGLSLVPPSIGLFLWMFEAGPATPLNLLAILLLPHVVLDAYAFVGKGMFEFHPATNRAAQRSAFENLQSPVFVLDETGRIVGLNSAAEALFDLDESDVMTQTVSETLGDAVNPESGESRYTLQSDGRRRVFRVETTPLTDSADNHLGYTLLFQEITQQVQRKERLSVLNRVLRHNLRNELTVVQGHLRIAEDRSPDDRSTESLALATDAVRSLIDTSETARSIERTLDNDDIERQRVAFSDLFAFVDEFRQAHPEATIEVDPLPVDIRTNAPILTAVLRQLVENAIKHNDSDEPVIEVRATRTDEGVDIVVTDNGPGIPDHEQQVLTKGTETALEHGSGLGLWLVRWGTTQLGGSVTFDETESGGSVRLSFPEAMLVDETAIVDDIAADRLSATADGGVPQPDTD